MAKSDNKIVLEPDEPYGNTMECSVSACFYMLNWETSNKIYMDDPSNAVATSQPDGKTYFLTNTQTHDMTGLSQITTIDFGSNQLEAGDTWGNADFTFTYPDPSVLYPLPIKLKSITLRLPAGDPTNDGMGAMNCNGLTHGKDATGKDKNPNFGKMPILYRNTDNDNNPLPFNNNTFRKTSPSDQDWSGWDNQYYMANYNAGTGDKKKYSPNFNFGEVSGNGVSTLYESTLNFSLDTRTAYAPDELAREITDHLSRLRQNMSNTLNGLYITDNKFLKFQRQVRTEITPAGGIEADTKIYFFCEDGTNYFNYDLNSADYTCGSDQMAVLYDEGNSKFNFGALHTPYYSDDNKIATRYIQNAGLGNIILVNKSMGVCLTNLSPKSLWYDAMGFESDILVAPSSIKVSYPDTSTTTQERKNWTVPILTRLDGQNSTGGFLGVDTCLNKKGASVYQTPTAIFQPQSEFESNNATVIYANIALQGGKLEEPYFLVEIGMNANQDYYGAGQTYKNNVKAIVGKYYSTNSYTTASSDSGVEPYIHFGEPFILSELNIRILDPNFFPAKGIQGNNAVFLEIIKATPPPPPTK